MKSVMANRLARAPSVSIPRSSFDRSHGFKTTFDGGFLVPIYVDEALPGDTFKMKSHHFARMATPIYPIMDNMFFETFFFEVPVRQVWDNWQKFNGEQDNPGDSTDYLIPTITSDVGGYAEGSIYDYMGIPTGVEGLEHSALPLRAYAHIYNEWFRDQNIQTAINFSRGDGPDIPANYAVRRRGKRHDYFTSALPWPQKSDAGSVSLPLGTSAPILFDQATTGQDQIVKDNVANSAFNSTGLGSDGAGLLIDELAGNFLNLDLNGTHYTDLTDATAATINQLRQSIAVQRLFEKDARGGTRYIEVIKQHFGVDSPDLRLQRPGYLGGGSTPINITPVAQTTQSFDGQTQTGESKGSLAAYGTLGASNHGFTRSFTEHTIIIGLANVRADLTYQQGLDRMWSRQTRFDHYWPELATIGEQEVLQKEIYASGVATEDDVVFGYQERFAEYRYKPSRITGAFRSTNPQSLDAWHLSQEFANAPTLSSQFINDDPPIDRVIAVPDEPHFIMDSYFDLKCARPMPMFGIPGLDKL